MKARSLVAFLISLGCDTAAVPTDAGGDPRSHDAAVPSRDATSPMGVRVVIAPRSRTVLVGVTVTLSATVTGTDDARVDFRLLDAGGCGAVSASGEYTAPSAITEEAIFCRVRATSVADPSAFDTASLRVARESSEETVGVWTRVDIPTPALLPDRAGAQTVLVDPVRPNDFYAFVANPTDERMIVLKSTDYGRTWADMNTTDPLRGNPWGAAIDPNPSRDPSTPPTLYTPAGFQSLGVWKSSDGGVTWVNTLAGPGIFDRYNRFGGTGAVDAYSVTVLPDDPPNHILFTYHYWWEGFDESGFGESLDGGETWIAHEPAPGMGDSHYIVALDESTWLAIAQGSDHMNGIWRTTTAGRVEGVVSPDAWEKVDPHEHLHGAFQGFVDPRSGSVYMPGRAGIRRSDDRGATWDWELHHVPGETFAPAWVSNITATDRYLYASNLFDPLLYRGPRDGDGEWEIYAPTPEAMTTGPAPFGYATSFDGRHWIIVLGAAGSGIWRYVEPE
jgi:hypothetical protein